MSLLDNYRIDVRSILKKFCIEGAVSEIKAYGSGNINDTFYLKNGNSACPDYLLQKINHHVFKDVPGLTRNIELVTAHLKKKVRLAPGEHTGREVLDLVPTLDHQLFHKDERGHYWRIYIFIPGSRSYDIVPSIPLAYEGGKAFGYFQSFLSDMNPQLLSETIVDFHNIKKRLVDFYEAIKSDPVGRVCLVQQEVAFIREHEQTMGTIYEWGKAGIIPKRIIHNDTKFNNILFGEDDKAICIIDLDTVMPGFAAYDFGDAIRIIINTAAEDELNLDEIQLNVPQFRAYTEGYIEAAGDFLTEQEIESLPFGMALLPYMQGVRFLTDYLNGDTYFKISYPEHNLVRARAQFQLLRKLEEKKAELRQIIDNAVRKQVI